MNNTDSKYTALFQFDNECFTVVLLQCAYKNQGILLVDCNIISTFVVMNID